jgi:cardiolipin synthase
VSSTAPAKPTSAVFTIPNAISALRLLGVPVFVWLVIGLHADVLALVLLMASGITDWADGFLARRLGQISTLGSILDPVADRLYILAVVVGLAWRDFVPWWMVIVLPLRDLLLWALVPFLRSRGYSALPVHYLGKAATFCLLYAFPLLFIARGHGTVSTVAQVLGWAFAVWGIALYWCAGVIYALQVRRLLRESEPRRDAFV